MLRKTCLVIVLVLAVGLAALLANYVYFRYCVACIESASNDERAAITAQVERDTMNAFRKRLALVREDSLPTAGDGKIAVREDEEDESDGFFLLADSTGNWVLVLVHSPHGNGIELRDMRVGLFAHHYSFEFRRENINLAGTRDGRVYRNDGHICMLMIPDEGSVEKFFQIDQSSGAPWNLIAPNPGVERPSDD